MAENLSTQQQQDLSNFENAAKKDLNISKQRYANGERSTVGKKKQFIDQDAAREKEKRDNQRDAFAHVDQDASHGAQSPVIGVLNVWLKRLLEGLKVGALLPSDDRDLYVTHTKDIKTGNEDAEFKDSKIKKNLDNEATPNVSLESSQKVTPDYPPINPEKAETGLKAEAVRSAGNVDKEYIKATQEATKPKPGHKFLVSDEPLGVNRNEDGSYSFSNDYENINYSYKSQKLDGIYGSEKYVTEVPDEAASVIAKKNQNEATGVRVSADLDNDISSKVDNKTIKQKQEKDLPKRRAANLKKQAEKKKQELKKTQNRKNGRSL